MNRSPATPTIVLVAALILAASSAGADERASDFGSGAFGAWTIDKNWLPAYEYTMRHDDPHAIWDPKTLPVTNLHWHHLGNDRVNANAYNLGMVKLFCGESGAVWLNDYEPEKNEHSGGFGWLVDGDTVLIDRDEYVPPGAAWERVFGTGYYLKRLSSPGLEIERRVFAPVGDHPALISEVRIVNPTGREKEILYIEYWDVNTRLMKDFLLGGGMGERLRDSRVRFSEGRRGALLLAAPPRVHGPNGGFPDRPMAVDPELPAVFVASLNQPVRAWITDPGELFQAGMPVEDPSILSSAGSARPPAGPFAQKDACLAMKFRIRLRAHSEQSLRFAFGYSKGEDPERIVARLLEQGGCDCGALFPDTVWHWGVSVPRFYPERDAFLARELEWDYYYFVASAMYDGYYQRHHIPQGANYLYASGGNGATRDYAAFVQTLSYYRPELAREILEFMMRSQETDGRLFYDLEGFGKRYMVPYRPGDLDLWFLGALCEYVLATRDFGFLDQPVPYYPLHRGAIGTVWEHATRSLDHLVNVVGTGPHGHPRLRLSDWNDEMMWLAAGSNPTDMIATFIRGESVMNTAMACQVLPLFRNLAETREDAASAGTAAAFLETMRSALPSAWHDDHLIRAYSGLGRPFGKDEMYLEPQVWALLAGDVLTPEQESILVEAIDKRLRKPSSLGMMISTSTSGSLTTRPGEQEEGGVWFAINGPGSVALSRFDPALAWDEVKRNTLAWHAQVYPDTWYGIWSGPDAWNSVFSDRPAETWYMKTPVFNTGPQMYPVQNAHSHCQTLYALARLAGISPGREGWTIEPRIPMEKYAFKCALYGIEKAPGRIGGYVRPPVEAELELRVAVPPGWNKARVVAKVNGEKVRPEWEGQKAVLRVKAGPASETKWEILSTGR